MSRKSGQPIVDEEDDGFTSTKWVPASQRSSKPVQEMNKQELETEAVSRNSEVTDATLNLRRLTEQTKDVAGQTLVTLNEQGEQIRRIHEKAVNLDQELEKVRGAGHKLIPSVPLCHLVNCMASAQRFPKFVVKCASDRIVSNGEPACIAYSSAAADG